LWKAVVQKKIHAYENENTSWHMTYKSSPTVTTTIARNTAVYRYHGIFMNVLTPRITSVDCSGSDRITTAHLWTAAVTRLISLRTKTSNEAAALTGSFEVAASRHWSWVHESARFVSSGFKNQLIRRELRRLCIYGTVVYIPAENRLRQVDWKEAMSNDYERYADCRNRCRNWLYKHSSNVINYSPLYS